MSHIIRIYDTYMYITYEPLNESHHTYIWHIYVYHIWAIKWVISYVYQTHICIWAIKWVVSCALISHITCIAGWRRLIGCLKLQVNFRKTSTNYRVFMRKMTYEDEASYDSTPLCTESYHTNEWVMPHMNESYHSHEWVMPYMNESYHTNQWVMSRTNESYYRYE